MPVFGKVIVLLLIVFCLYGAWNPDVLFSLIRLQYRILGIEMKQTERTFTILRVGSLLAAVLFVVILIAGTLGL